MRTQRALVVCAVALLGACSAGTAPVGDASRDDGAADVMDVTDVTEVGPACLGGEPRASGGTCTCPGDCRGLVCATEEDTGIPGGFCLDACDPAQPAASGFVCETYQMRSFYLPRCGPGAEGACRDGMFCRVSPQDVNDRSRDIYRCYAWCTGDAQCATGHCNRYTGLCEPESEGRPNGAACTVNEQCRSEFCIRSGEGTCASLCDIRDGYCPDDGFCLPPPQAASGAENGTCLPRCTTAADCRRGSTCTRVAGRMLCLPNL
ncbi:MAG: hypothetical protein U0324_47135 [Polyangiales bacterium]